MRDLMILASTNGPGWWAPDTGTLVLAVLLLAALLVAYVADIRRVDTEAGPARRWERLRRSGPPFRPLTVGRLVQIDAGEHAGLCGWVREFRVDDAGRRVVLVELQNGAWVQADRDHVSPVLG